MIVLFGDYERLTLARVYGNTNKQPRSICSQDNVFTDPLIKEPVSAITTRSRDVQIRLHSKTAVAQLSTLYMPPNCPDHSLRVGSGLFSQPDVSFKNTNSLNVWMEACQPPPDPDWFVSLTRLTKWGGTLWQHSSSYCSPGLMNETANEW